MWIAATFFSFTLPSNAAAVLPGWSVTRSSGTSAEITTRRGGWPAKSPTEASAASANAVYSRSSTSACGASRLSQAVTVWTVLGFTSPLAAR
ncbi:hypothetical protein O1R50_02975 [Glycomyces luteolus]|uniref:Secreted protein n=1 Tax=Glycomyces luteolus TaxID=2670330 RepID=A0A9X3P5A3_9ACTN|nr:hypothetical protein [Glycomyces luteolus]MDA1358567.1 hypothetical protein [Glycomyces luteolus]